MKHHIDPKIDCVFKALLGAEKNRNLLQHFLNAILAEELTQPLISVEILNPYNEKEFIGDKLSIVDVKAKDNEGRIYQIEIQLTGGSHLPKRIIYNWTDIYSQQLETGTEYKKLKPTYSIWLLAEDLIKNNKNYCHNYKLRDEQGKILHEHGGIFLFELNKFNIQTIKGEDQRWLRFFKDGAQLDDKTLPDWMNTEEMRQAMTTLSVFSEKERDYYKYQARQEYLRVQNAIQQENEENAAALEHSTKMLEKVENKLGETEGKLGQTENKLGKTEDKLGKTEDKLGKTEDKLGKAELEIEQLKAMLAQKNSLN